MNCQRCQVQVHLSAPFCPVCGADPTVGADWLVTSHLLLDGAGRPLLPNGGQPEGASTFELALSGADVSILAVVHGSLCTQVQAAQDALSALSPGGAQKKFARIGAVKATVRYGKYLELTDPVVKAKGAFRFLDPGTLELTFEDGTVNLVLIARGYLYALEKPLTDTLTGLIGATIGTADTEPEEVTAPN